MRKTLIGVTVLLALLGLSACGGEAADEPAPTEPAATPTEGDSAVPEEDAMPEEAAIEGTLGGDAQLEGGCAWVDTAGGRYQVLWPTGYEILFDPVRLEGPDGEVVAEEGDTLRVDGRTAPDMMSVCMTGILYQADTVTPAP